MPADPNGGGTFRLIVRGSPTTDATDTGCELTQLTRGYQLGLLPAGDSLSLDTDINYFLLSATFVPSGATAGPNLRCTLDTLDGRTASLSASVAMPGGRVAFGATSAAVTIVGLGVYERDDAPL
jgi:hypothetical protein